MSDAPPVDRTRRLSLLLALEIDRLERLVRTRRDFLVTLWSRHRSRDAFRDTLFSRWKTLTAGELADLPVEAVEAVIRFYDLVDAFRLYVDYTEDMPTMLGDEYDRYARRLANLAAPAIEALGGVPEREGAALPAPPSLDVPDEAP